MKASTQTFALLRDNLGGRRALVVLALAAVGAGLYLSWGWLAAIGIAPLLVALAPCAAMCALGLCANRNGGQVVLDRFKGEQHADNEGRNGSLGFVLASVRSAWASPARRSLQRSQ